MLITFVKNTETAGYPAIQGSATGGSYDPEPAAFVPMPSGIVPGERLLIMLALVSDSSVATTPASGWTAIESGSAEENLSRVVIYERTATGTEGASVLVSFSATASWASVAVRVSDVAQLRSISFLFANDIYPDPPALSWSSGSRDSLVLAIGAVNFADTLSNWSASPANYSTVATSRPSHAGNAKVSVRVAQRQLPDISSENPGTFVLGSPHQWAACTLLLSADS